MQLEQISIKHYRSIENIVVKMPKNKPLILFGPNNAGKSNILSAIDRALGERYPTYLELQDSDYFMRDKKSYPRIDIGCKFDDTYYVDKKGKDYREICLTYGFDNDSAENLLHDCHGNRLYISNDQRGKLQSFLINAERNIQSTFSYASKYSMLSKFSHRVHESLTGVQKDELVNAFETIKSTFESTAEFGAFFERFSGALKNAVNGFVHSLTVDFSAYDPNNYAKSMRVLANEGGQLRSFEEFGTGEQQVLLMAFVKAYMETFASESFVLIIEEPEAHLHPLAQRWLKEYVYDLCKTGIQVILSTHSTEFIAAANIDGMVRVYKDSGITKIVQIDPAELCTHCIECGAPEDKVSPENICDFYETKLFTDQLRGVFAEKIILVEGATEYFALPQYLKRAGYSLSAEGTEIVNCRGKDAIPLFFRLFTAFGYKCYCLFDGDEKKKGNTILGTLLQINAFCLSQDKFTADSHYGYFGKDFETYLIHNIDGYSDLASKISEHYKITSKPGIAKAVAEKMIDTPDFVNQIVVALKKM